MSARNDYPINRIESTIAYTIDPGMWKDMCDEIDCLRAALEATPFPPHTGAGPDVNPATGDERETTTGPATDGPWDGPDDDGPVAA